MLTLNGVSYLASAHNTLVTIRREDAMIGEDKENQDCKNKK